MPDCEHGVGDPSQGLRIFVDRLVHEEERQWILG